MSSSWAASKPSAIATATGWAMCAAPISRPRTVLEREGEILLVGGECESLPGCDLEQGEPAGGVFTPLASLVAQFFESPVTSSIWSGWMPARTTSSFTRIRAAL